MLRSSHAGRVVWFAPFNANACEALAARLGLLPLGAPNATYIYSDDGTPGYRLFSSMGALIFQCPITGLNVQGFAAWTPTNSNDT